MAPKSDSEREIFLAKAKTLSEALPYMRRYSGRTFVINPQLAHLLMSIRKFDPSIRLPDLNSCALKVYRRTFTDGLKWERDLLDDLDADGKVVTSEDIRKRPGKYVVNLEHWKLAELLDIKPVTGSPFIHSKIECFDAETVEEARVTDAWLQYFGMPRYQVHASGHLSQAQVREVIGRIKPRVIIPMHTEAQEEFEHFGTVVYPRLNEEVAL